jgi:hypothetical protein
MAWEGRWDVAGNTLKIASDFALTGGGLASFAGLYSRYILEIPWLFVPQSINLLLDTAVEQGLFGAIALATILIGSVWRCLNTDWRNTSIARSETLHRALLTSAVALANYGFLEDPFYNGWGTLFLFVPAGLTVALSSAAPAISVVTAPASKRPGGIRRIVLAAGTAASVGLLINWVPPVRSVWLANLGAVIMSRTEISGFPGNPRYWSGFDIAELGSAKALFAQSLTLDPSNLSANYRSGLIAAMGDDNVTAARFWETAHRSARHHRGLQKMLGYAYVWTGRIADAESLLRDIPEAPDEMWTYSWRWKTQGRLERSQYAAEVAQRLAGP